MTISRADAKALAIRYDAYNDARRTAERRPTPANWNTVACWAQMLLDTQEKTGIEMFEPGTIERMRDHARHECIGKTP